MMKMIMHYAQLHVIRNFGMLHPGRAGARGVHQLRLAHGHARPHSAGRAAASRARHPVNLLANDEETARFFSHHRDSGAMNNERLVLAYLHENVLRYYDSWWHKIMARLRRDYFSNPWSAIAVIAATLTFALQL